MADLKYTSINVSMSNKEWLEKQRDRIARGTPYPRKVSLDEAFTSLRVAHEQRQKLNERKD